jgi:TetR/AcrR family transcriptional regulator, regulator of cefoperazone and chloramphenicol sensitivity
VPTRKGSRAGGDGGGVRNRRDAELTKALLMEAGEEIFARDGVRLGSMTAVLRAAGQRNEAAIAYHFGSRDGLALAIVESRRAPYAAKRIRMLAEAASSGEPPTLRRALEILVCPIAAALETHAGRNYLRIVAQLFRELYHGERLRPRAADFRQAIRLVQAGLVHLPEEIAEERLLFAVSAMTEAMATRAADLEHGPDVPLGNDVWAENLLLMLEAMLNAPLPAHPSAPPWSTHATAEAPGA